MPTVPGPMTQLFMVRGFLGEEQSDQAGLKQGLMRAIKSLQEALDALYTDAVRVSSVPRSEASYSCWRR